MSRIAGRREDVMLRQGIHSRYRFARRLGYDSISPHTAVYRGLAGKDVTCLRLCDIARRMQSIPLLFFMRRTGKPLLGPGGENRFRSPIDYNYFEHSYVGAVLKARRLEHKLELGQAELATMAGLPKQTVCEIEHGGYSPSVPQTLDKICAVLGLDVEFFVTPRDVNQTPPERKSALQSIHKLVESHRQIGTAKKFSQVIGMLPASVDYILREGNISTGFLSRVCASLHATGISGPQLPLIIWYYDDKTRDWRIETLGSDMITSGRLPDKYAQRAISKHRTLQQIGPQQFSRRIRLQGYDASRFKGSISTAKLEVLLQPLNLIPQYLVETLRVGGT